MKSILKRSSVGHYEVGVAAGGDLISSVSPLEMLIELCLYSNHFYVKPSGSDCAIRTDLQFIQTQWSCWSVGCEVTFRFEYHHSDQGDGTDQILKNDLCNNQ